MNENEAMDRGPPPAVDLRQEAERRLRNKKATPAAGMAEIDARALLHELQVHQIELERQNNELLRTRAMAEEASEKYQDLFDFAPVGYFLWDVAGRILEVNLAGAALLGLDRSLVVRKRFGQFVATEHRASFADFCHRVLATDAKQTCEVKILKHSQAVAATVEGIAVQERQGKRRACRAMVIDISQRKHAEEEIKTLNESLEQRIAERTKAIQMLHDVATVANQAQNAEQAIEYCLRRVAMYNGWCFGHALLSAADNADELVPAHAYYAEDPDRFRRFREMTFGLRLRRGQGMPGRVLASGKLEWTTDLRGDLIERRALVAEELGIGTAVAFPVLLGEKVAAVLEFFSDRVIQPDSWIADAMVGVGLQLARVIERAEFEEHLLTVAEEIQRGIAQDLHDDVGQELTGLGLKAQTLAEMLAPGGTPAGKLAANIATAVDRTHDKVRGLSRGMLPIELGEGLLASALEQLAAATTAGSRIACKLDCSRPDAAFDSRVSMHLYRIAQEAVSNAVRHSRAQNIRISLDHEDGKTVLRIEDEGKGLPTSRALAGGMGLRTMHYRAGLIGGKLEVGPGSRGGTQVVCRLAAPPPKIQNAKSNRRRS